ncbi:MAG: quaternary ammonium compound efflux SMR transporter SugE [Acidobacteria bacterium]|nr:quaternary ammonium compound efflux SMR transporter SugE [Acidobacteriota bacterium]
MAWIYLFLAGVMEIAWTVGLKYAQGFTRLGPSLFTAGAIAMSMFLLAQSLRVLPIGTAYAIWTGIGAVGAALWGIVFFDEPRHWTRLACIALIVLGIAGLRLTSLE